MSRRSYDSIMLAKEKMLRGHCGEICGGFFYGKRWTDAEKAEESLFSSGLSEFDRGKILRGACEIAES